ncbi:MAG TPA: PIN domain-containing protein [Thermoanaerobaculia bacterium]|jgi:predicted nucleic acid-binding protein
MIERLAVDSNAIIVWFRSGNLEPLALHSAQHLVLPLPVVGELYTGVYSSKKRDSHLTLLEAFIGRHEILKPDEETARSYGRLRAELRLDNIGRSKTNDLWIAALCIQHGLPLLSNDHGFHAISNLTTIRW